jgi:hypothetical protein
VPALPPLPNSEPLDKRIALPFLVLAIALVVPGVPQVFSPTDEVALRDTVSELQSQVKDATVLIDRRDGTTRLYFASELDDLGASADEARDELREQPFEPSVADTRSTVIEALDEFSTAADDAAVSFDERARLAEVRSKLEDIAKTLATLPGGS